MNKIVELSSRQCCATAHDADLLCDVDLVDHNRDGVCVLEIEDAWRAIRERVRDGLARGDAAVGIEPLHCARNVRELGASLAVRVELRPIRDDQTFIRTDRAGRGEHVQRDLARGRPRVVGRKVGAGNQRSLARNWCNAVRLKNLGAEYLRCRGARTAGIAPGQLV